MNGVSTQRGVVRGVQLLPHQDKIVGIVENPSGQQYIFVVNSSCGVKLGEEVGFFKTSLGYVKFLSIGEHRHSAFPLTPEISKLYGDGIGSIANLDKPKSGTSVGGGHKLYYYVADDQNVEAVTELQLHQKFHKFERNRFILHKTFGSKSKENVELENKTSFNDPSVAQYFSTGQSSQSKANTTEQQNSLKLETQKMSNVPKMLIVLCFALFGSWAIASDLGSKSTCANAEISMARTISNLRSNPDGLQQLGGEFGLSAPSLASGLLGGKLGDGRMMAIAAKDQYPRLPTEAGCTILYWDMFLRSL